MSPFTSIKSSSSRTAVISFVFFSTQISPNVSWFSATNALTTWYARCLSFPLPQIVFSSIATVPRLFLSTDIQFIRHDEGSDGFSFSNTYLNVSLSGIPFGSSRNVARYFWRLLPNTSISTKSSPPHMMVHSSMIIISSSLFRIFPYPVLLGSLMFFISSFEFSIFASLFYHFFWKLNAVAV